MNRMIIPFQALGMAQDMSPSARPLKPSLAFENLNLRISTNDGNTLYSMVNERGTKSLSLISGTGWEEGDGRTLETEILGTPIGTAVINGTLVVFTHDRKASERKDALERTLNNKLKELDKAKGESLTFGLWITAMLQLLSDCEVIDFDDSDKVDAIVNEVDEIKASIENYYGKRKKPTEIENCLIALDNIETAVYESRMPAAEDKSSSINYLTVIKGNIDSSITELQGEIEGLEETINAIHEDRIYLLKYSSTTKDSLKCVLYYAGDLNFDENHPLETLISYEAENIQKVYWTDGINQPRVINISRFDDNYNDDSFNFIRELKLQETVSVAKVPNGLGTFAPGVIQYAITYYTKYGQESNIAYTTPLLYIAHANRGASPEDRVNTAFSIKISNADTNFDYIRIYSVQRTSINAVPICKRVTDIPINTQSENAVYTYIDRGIEGSSIDPTELLYVGGTVVSAYTMEQKDNTLFLGNLKTLIPRLDSSITKDIKKGVTTSEWYRVFLPKYYNIDLSKYSYSNQLTSLEGSNYSKVDDNVTVTINNDKEVPCGGFKRFNYYRLGVQFQYKTGAWSEPVFIEDHQITGAPEIWDGKTYVNGSSNRSFRTTVKLPAINGTIPKSVSKELIKLGYKRIRPVVVFPDNQDRQVICQGVLNPVIYNAQRYNNYKMGYWPSWFFRPYPKEPDDSKWEGVPYFGTSYLHLCDTKKAVEGQMTRVLRAEIQGNFDSADKDAEDVLKVSYTYATLHSPEIIFNEGLVEADYINNTSCWVSGAVSFKNALYSLDLQVSSPAKGADAKGPLKFTGSNTASHGTVSGYWFEDNTVDDYSNGHNALGDIIKWRIYPWQRTGSLNNDISDSRGVQSAVLKKKVISNLWYTNTYWFSYMPSTLSLKTFNTSSVLWTGEDYQAVKFKDDTFYSGHVDELLRPSGTIDFADTADHKYYPTLGAFDVSAGDAEKSMRYYKGNVRMKYKTTGHLFISSGMGDSIYSHASLAANGLRYTLPIVEYINPIDTRTIFGGQSEEALKQNIWVPCGEPVYLNTDSATTFQWSYGDTYYQRFDCLKTYPYTTEDENQIVDIGSFVLETYVNIDGRYDRNRGQMDNTDMSPTNFNLLNPVYSQKDNFFSYRITSDENTQKAFPNQVTWTRTKQSGEDVDTWTNITLASILEMDGDKGKVTALRRKNNNLICFQDSGISQILYNENVQVASTEGVPIEIANSEKVLGKRYYTNTIGCSNKWSLLANDNGIYFMDSLNKALFMMTDTTTNLGVKGNMSVWIRNNMPAWSNADNSWTPTDHNDFVTYWDKQNQDILFINKDIALAWSEKLGAFTSFYSYGDTPYFCNLEDTGIWLRKKSETIPPKKEGEEPTIKESVTLWQHNTGEYCNFFDEQQPYSTVLVANSPEDTTDKLFTNMEITASMKQEGVLDNTGYHPYMPFTSLESWTEYQHGIATLQDKEGTLGSMRHALSNSTAHLDRKFRTWRCDIPRDNYPVLTAPIAPIEPVDPTQEQQKAYKQAYAKYQEALAEYNAYLQDAENKGITRLSKHPLDRMRNPWVYLKLHKDEEAGTDIKAEIHSINVIYYQ